MPTPLPPGPYKTFESPDHLSIPFYLLPFDKDGNLEAPKTLEHLLAHLDDVTDIFVFSHGWNNDFTVATRRYEHFATGLQAMRIKRKLPLPYKYQPVMIGIFWPSQPLEFLEKETGPKFAGGTPGAPTTLTKADPAFGETVEFLKSVIPAPLLARFETLTNAVALNAEQANELADMLAKTLAGISDTEAGAQAAPNTSDLLASASAFETPAIDVNAVGTIIDEDEDDDDPANQPVAAFNIIDAIKALDPRNLIKPFSVWLMKDRAGTVGANGVRLLLEQLLSTSTARIHLLGHSYGCKVVMTAVSRLHNPPRKIESALLLQPALSQYAFSENVPERHVPGGFVKALERVQQPILATFSRYDVALTQAFHLSVRRHDDVGELQYAATTTPSKFGALGGFGPQATKSSHLLLNKPGEPYTFNTYEQIVGVNGSRVISGHGEISNEDTWWAEYSLITAHLQK